MTEPSVNQLFDLTGKTALITGATGYLGSAMAYALAEAGAQVIVGSRDSRRAMEFTNTLPQAGANHFGVELDYFSEDSLRTGFQQAARIANQIDILVNNGSQSVPRDLTDVTATEFNRQLEVATGYFVLSRLFHDHVCQRIGGGSIVMIGSMYGVVGSYPDAYETICNASPVQYHALKGGIIQMTRHLAVYWAGDQVRVNCLSPGPFPSDKAPSEMVERLVEKSPMKRMGSPEELKGPLLLLASDAGSYITGQNLLVDGGWTAW